MEVKPIIEFKRAESKYLKREILKVELIPVPSGDEKTILEKLGNSAPYFILAYGKSAINKLVDWVPLPPFVSQIIRWTAKGISFAARRYSVEEKELGG